MMLSTHARVISSCQMCEQSLQSSMKIIMVEVRQTTCLVLKPDVRVEAGFFLVPIECDNRVWQFCAIIF